MIKCIVLDEPIELGDSGFWHHQTTCGFYCYFNSIDLEWMYWDDNKIINEQEFLIYKRKLIIDKL